MRSYRWILACLALFLLFPSASSFASDARLDALGVQYEYVEDYYLFRYFPTVAARYANLAMVSLGGRNLDNGDYYEDYSVGVIGAGDNTSYGAFGIFLNHTGHDAQFDITWAKQFEKFALGIGFLWQKSNKENGEYKESPIGKIGPTGRVMGVNTTSFVAGGKFDIADQDQLEVAAELYKFSWERTDANGVLQAKNDGKLSYRLEGRMMTELNPKTTLVPLINYVHSDISRDPNAGGGESSYANTFNLGVAVHREVNGSDLLIMGIAANYMKYKNWHLYGDLDGRELSAWDLPALFAALEFDLADWLTMRAGATKTLDLVTNESTVTSGDKTTSLQSQFIFGLGFGIHFEHFDLDATLNPDAVFTGGYLISGEEVRLLGRITGTYYF